MDMEFMLGREKSRTKAMEDIVSTSVSQLAHETFKKMVAEGFTPVKCEVIGHNPVPPCGHRYRSRRCHICMLTPARQEADWRMQGYLAYIADKLFTDWPHTGVVQSGEWYRRKYSWQAG